MKLIKWVCVQQELGHFIETWIHNKDSISKHLLHKCLLCLLWRSGRDYTEVQQKSTAIHLYKLMHTVLGLIYTLVMDPKESESFKSPPPPFSTCYICIFTQHAFKQDIVLKVLQFLQLQLSCLSPNSANNLLVTLITGEKFDNQSLIRRVVTTT